MSITAIADVTALVITDLTTPQLQAQIDREESALIARVGHPSAERTQTFIGQSSIIALGRPALAVDEVTTDIYNPPVADPLVVTDDYAVYFDRGIIERVGAPYYTFFTYTVVTWTPIAFTDQFKDAVIELVRLRLSRRGFKSERVGNEWGYTAPDWEEEREKIIGALVGAVFFG